MTRERWIAVIVGVLAVIIAYVLLSLAHDAQGETVLPSLPKCMENEIRDKLQRLTFRAVDQGYQRHVSHLFDVLMGNPNIEQFNRARVGMQNGIKGYLLAQTHIDGWMPPLCTESK